MVNINIKLKPFDIPDQVSVESKPGRRQDGIVMSPTFLLSELESDVLADLCQDFVDGVFTKARKANAPGTVECRAINGMRTIVIYRLVNYKEREQGFTGSMRWSKDRKFNNVHWSKVDFENLSDEKLLEFYETTIRQMSK